LNKFAPWKKEGSDHHQNTQTPSIPLAFHFAPSDARLSGLTRLKMLQRSTASSVYWCTICLKQSFQSQNRIRRLLCKQAEGGGEHSFIRAHFIFVGPGVLGFIHSDAN